MKYLSFACMGIRSMLWVANVVWVGLMLMYWSSNSPTDSVQQCVSALWTVLLLMVGGIVTWSLTSIVGEVQKAMEATKPQKDNGPLDFLNR